MLLIPLGLAGRKVRLVPWVTLALILANVAAFTITMSAGAGRGEVEVLGALVEEELKSHPCLLPGERLSKVLGPDGVTRLAEARPACETPPPAPEMAREQSELDTLVADYVDALGRLPWRRFGYLPAEPTLLSLLTSMFLHAGWLHLLGNMLFLYVSGPYVEDCYGRTLFLLSYLGSGVAAALGYGLGASTAGTPLVGASGAIAGLMGIVLVRLTRARIRFLFLPLVFLPNIRIPLSLPGVIVLPLWLAEQLWYAQHAPDEGVAWWAHVSGFVFGCVLAAAVAFLRIEERWLGRTVSQDEGQRAALDAREARLAADYAQARAQVSRALRSSPDSSEALTEQCRLALAEGSLEDLARALPRLLDLLPRRGDVATGLDLIEEIPWATFEVPRLRIAVATFLEGQRRLDEALAHYDAAIEAAPRDPAVLRALLRKAEILGSRGERGAAIDSLERARAHPAADDRWQEAIARALAAIGG